MASVPSMVQYSHSLPAQADAAYRTDAYATTTGFIPRCARVPFGLSGGFSPVTLKNVFVPLQFYEALLT
jgi:hypothetical protein